MATTNYYTVNGRIIGESTGGTRTGYLPDALGSVTATVQNGAVVNTYRYKPYGEMLTKTGGGADPKYRWIGMYGSRYVSTDVSYVRARHYDMNKSQWMSIDSAWPYQSSYQYCDNSPVVFIDKSGDQKVNPIEAVDVHPTGTADIQCTRAWNDYIYKYCNDCYAGRLGEIGSCYTKSGCAYVCDAIARKYYNKCKFGYPRTCCFRPWPRFGGIVAPMCRDPHSVFSSPPPGHVPPPSGYSDRLKDYESRVSCWEDCLKRYYRGYTGGSGSWGNVYLDNFDDSITGVDLPPIYQIGAFIFTKGIPVLSDSLVDGFAHNKCLLECGPFPTPVPIWNQYCKPQPSESLPTYTSPGIGNVPTFTGPYPRI
jgi:RHS repeat-associated protein